MKYFLIVLILIFIPLNSAYSQNLLGNMLDELICIKKEINISDSIDCIFYDRDRHTCLLINETDSFQVALLSVNSLLSECNQESQSYFSVILLKDKVNNRHFLFHYICIFDLCIDECNKIYIDLYKCNSIKIKKITELSVSENNLVLYELPVNTKLWHGDDILENKNRKSRFFNRAYINYQFINLKQDYFLYEITYDEFLTISSFLKR